MFVKKTFDAFGAEGLSDYLVPRKGLLLLAGLETSFCVLLSAASATQHGLASFLVEDCSADDPQLEQYVARRMLAHYDAKLFWKTSLDELKDEETYDRFMQFWRPGRE